MPGDVVGRLGEAVDRTDFERRQRHFGATLGQRRHHHDRHRPQPHDLLKELEPVHVGHLDVERDDVRVEVLDHLAGGRRIGRPTDHFDALVARQHRRQQAPDGRGVIDDQDADALHGHAPFRR